MNLKANIHALLARDELSEAIDLLLRELPESHIEEAIMQSARFHDLQKQIRLGLIDYQAQALTKSQIRYGILEFVKTLEGAFQLSVLVAGTGRRDLPTDVYLMAKAIGQKLGEAGIKLICGGWEGVDFVVADEYAQAIRGQGLRLSEHLIQVVTEDSEPVFKGGNILYVRRGIKEWLEAIKYADIVLLIGGEGGTYGTYVYAHQEGRPIIPLPATGGDAQDVYDEMIEKWPYWQSQSFKGIDRQAFEALSLPINQQPKSASVLAGRAIELIRQVK